MYNKLDNVHCQNYKTQLNINLKLLIKINKINVHILYTD